MATLHTRPSSSSPSSNDRRAPGQGIHIQLLEAEGGAVRAGVVAKRLGVPAPMVEQLRQAGRLLAVADARGYLYPSWQFEGRGLLAGLPAVRAALQSADPWQQVDFFLTPHDQLGGQRPLDRLRAGAVGEVVRVARADGGGGPV